MSDNKNKNDEKTKYLNSRINLFNDGIAEIR